MRVLQPPNTSSRLNPALQLQLMFTTRNKYRDRIIIIVLKKRVVRRTLLAPIPAQSISTAVKCIVLGYIVVTET